MSMDPAARIDAARIECHQSDPGTESGKSAASQLQNRETHPHWHDHLSSPTANSPAPAEDAVQVQRENGKQIVIRYLDHSGAVILQVPSSQVLRLQQAIESQLEQADNRKRENESKQIPTGGNTDGR